MTPVRMLGACGMLAALYSAISGFTDTPYLLGVAGLVMLLGNVFAMVRG